MFCMKIDWFFISRYMIAGLKFMKIHLTNRYMATISQKNTFSTVKDDDAIDSLPTLVVTEVLNTS